MSNRQTVFTLELVIFEGASDTTRYPLQPRPPPGQVFPTKWSGIFFLKHKNYENVKNLYFVFIFVYIVYIIEIPLETRTPPPKKRTTFYGLLFIKKLRSLCDIYSNYNKTLLKIDYVFT